MAVAFFFWCLPLQHLTSCRDYYQVRKTARQPWMWLSYFASAFLRILYSCISSKLTCEIPKILCRARKTLQLWLWWQILCLPVQTLALHQEKKEKKKKQELTPKKKNYTSTELVKHGSHQYGCFCFCLPLQTLTFYRD